MWLPPILTPSRDFALELRLAVIFLGLSPSMLVSWLRARFPRAEPRLPFGWYAILLAAIAAAGYLLLGVPFRLRPPALPAWFSLPIGVALGAFAVGVELAVSALRRRLQGRAAFAGVARVAGRAGGAGGGGAGEPGRQQLWLRHLASQRRRQLIEQHADIPTGGEVVWRLHEEGPPWRDGLADLLLVAVLEECIYRQILLDLLAPMLGGMLGAAVVSTLGFGLIHTYFGLGSVVAKWVMGGVFAAATLAGAGLLAPILGHCMLNATWTLLVRRRTRPPQVAAA